MSNLGIAMQEILFLKVDVYGLFLGRKPLWFDFRKRQLSLRILGGCLRKVRLYFFKVTRPSYFVRVPSYFETLVSPPYFVR